MPPQMSDQKTDRTRFGSNIDRLAKIEVKNIARPPVAALPQAGEERSNLR
jgi:hypothetical protein